jgi:hypothetical protein
MTGGRNALFTSLCVVDKQPTLVSPRMVATPTSCTRRAISGKKRIVKNLPAAVHLARSLANLSYMHGSSGDSLQ